MAYNRNSHSTSQDFSSNSHASESSAQYFTGSVPAVDTVYPWCLTSNGGPNFHMSDMPVADNTGPNHSTLPALWGSAQQLGPPYIPDFSSHEASQGNSQVYHGVSPPFFHSPHPSHTQTSSQQTDYSPMTSPHNQTFASVDSFPSPSSSLSSTLSIEIDTVGEEVEPPIPGAVKNVVGSQKIAAAAHKRRSRSAKYFCQYCDAEFTARHNLDYHINSHTGKKPYKCNKGCPYAAPSPATVRRHEKSCQGKV